MVRQGGIMASKKERRQEGDSVLESLRLERTTLTQDEFAVACGIPRTTYQRWVSGKTPAKLTLPQLKAIARLLEINSINELPDDFGPRVRSHSEEKPE